MFHADRQADRETGGRSDGHDEADSRFSRFCERAYKRLVFPYVTSQESKLALVNKARLPLYLLSKIDMASKKAVSRQRTKQHLRYRKSTRFSRTLVKLRKATISFVMSVRLSIRPHGTTRLLQDGFL